MTDTRGSEAMFDRGSKVLVEGVSSASRGFGSYPRYMTHGNVRDSMMSMEMNTSIG